MTISNLNKLMSERHEGSRESGLVSLSDAE